MLTRRKMIEVALGTAALAGMVPALSHAQEPNKQDVFFDKDAPVLGNVKGDVTIVEFFDYQCPYCKQVHPTIRKVVAEDGDVRLVLKDWPIFGGPSIFAAQAVLAAAQIGRYEPALEALMNTSARLSEEIVEEAFDGAGIMMADIVTSVNKYNAKISGLLDRNYNQARAFNFAGTPSFVIGASLYPGVLDEKALKEAIAKTRLKLSHCVGRRASIIRPAVRHHFGMGDGGWANPADHDHACSHGRPIPTPQWET